MIEWVVIGPHGVTSHHDSRKKADEALAAVDHGVIIVTSVDRTSELVTWHGKAVKLMDRDELIVALNECYEAWTAERDLWIKAARPLVELERDRNK